MRLNVGAGGLSCVISRKPGGDRVFKRAPAPMGGGQGILEIREIFEAADFEGVASPEQIRKEEAWRRKHEQRSTH